MLLLLMIDKKMQCNAVDHWPGSTPTLTTSTWAPQLRRPGSANRYRSSQLECRQYQCNHKYKMLSHQSQSRLSSLPKILLNPHQKSDMCSLILTPLPQVVHHPSTASDHKPVIVKLELKENDQSWNLQFDHAYVALFKPMLPSISKLALF